jgi:hypothetical protein
VESTTGRGDRNKFQAKLGSVTRCSPDKIVILGTATPIQTKLEDLWDLMGILHQGCGNFVLGNDLSKWHRPKEVLPILSGEQRVTEPSFRVYPQLNQ